MPCVNSQDPAPPPPRLKVMPIILTPLTLTPPWVPHDYGQTSDDSRKPIMCNTPFNTVSLVFLDRGSNTAFSDLWCRCAVLENGWKEVKNIFGSGMLTTKYPGAVSGTNSNKSFSKGTVVNRVFLFSPTAYFRETKGTFTSWSARGDTKNKRNKTIFSFNFLTISNMRKTFDLNLSFSASAITNEKATHQIVFTTDLLV